MAKTDKHYKINNGRLDILEGFIQYEGYTLLGTISRDIDFYKEINFNEVRALIFNSDIKDKTSVELFKGADKLKSVTINGVDYTEKARRI